MNYRTMVKGALALSLSLIVGSSWAGDSQQYGATFEQTPVGTVENDFAYTNNMPITDSTLRGVADSQPYGWFSGSEEDESKVVERTDAAGGHALQLNTDANTLTNQLAKSVAEKLNNVLAGENGETQGVVYFETDVKFVASDTDDAGIKGNTDATKFAIYAYCNEEAETVTTNLVVYHAYYDENNPGNNFTSYTNEVFKSVLIDTEVYTKLRIEMKKLEVDEGSYQNVFSVSINGGDPISSATALDKALDPTAPGIWFQTVEMSDLVANLKVASLNFKGTGEIDNIKAGVIEEAQPLDDTWTIEGFNPRGEWTDPTAVAADSKTLFYSNLVVNIDAADSSIGRTIDAAWIGAKIVAPEAVTSENASQWTIAVGSATYTFDQVKESEGNYFYLWVPVTAAKVRTAIATQSDIVYTVEAYTDPSAKQTLSMVINPKNIEITNTSDVPNAETIEVIDWAEQGVVEPTVISVAKLSATGAMVNDAAPTLTATVTDENGDAVAAADYTIDASAIDMTTAGLYPVIITATGAGYAGTLTNYYAVMNLTWFNGTPTQKAMVTNAYIGLGGGSHEGSHWMRKSENGRFLAINHQAGNGGTGCKALSLYELATLTNLYGVCYSHWEFAQCKQSGPNGGATKGVAVSEAAGLVTLGNVDYSPTVDSTFDIDDVSNKAFGTELPYAFIKNGASVTLKHDSPTFSTDGNYLYVNNYNPSSSRNIISKFAVDKANNQFVWVQDYVGSATRIRSLEVYAINGRDYVFYGEGGGSLTGNIYAMDTVTGESTLICSARESAAFDNEVAVGPYDGPNEVQLVRISGIASGEMYLYAHSDLGVIVVWALRHDVATGTWKTALVREFTKAEYLALCDEESLGNSRNLEVSDDNQYGFILPHNTYDARLIAVTDISLAQRKALASATLTPAGSDKDVALGAITATVLDENGDTVAASEYTITTNGIDIATAGEYTVTITPVEGSVYSNAVTAVYTISEAAPAQKPAWAADSGDGSDQDPYWAWATAHAAGQDLYAEGADYSAQYLMNVDADKTPVLKIDSIQVGSGAAVIIVSATDGTDPISLATINGVLNVAVGSSVTALTPKALGRDPVVSQDGRAMVVISTEDGSFYRARVDFAAAETALTPVVISGGE